VAAPQSNFAKQIGMIWSRLQWSQRLTIISFAAAVLIGLGSLIAFMNRVDYQVLFRDLSPEDAQAIATKLREDKIDFVVSADGTSIQVAAAKEEVDKLRLEVAGSGLARSGRAGYELFDKTQFGMTDFAEQVNYKRALEGELSRTVSSLNEISQARVHLVMPKDTLFEEKKEEAKASVLIRLRRGRELSQSSISGIVNLVSGAVQGLQPKNVSLVDEKGQVLSRPAPAGDGLQTELEADIRAQLEKGMIAKVVSILEPVVGKGKVHANASVELDFNSSEQTEETYSPNPQLILSQQKSEERVTPGGGPSGIPGTQSNIEGAGVSAASTPGRLRQSETTNYEVNRLVRHTIQPKGQVRRISVAVILDHKPNVTRDDQGRLVTSYAPRTKEELDSCRELVLAAVGYNAERGDTVTLENIPFFNELVDSGEETAPPWYVSLQPYLLPAIKYSAFILLFLLVYLVVFRPLRKRVYESLAASAQLLSAGVPQAALPGTAAGTPAGPLKVPGALPAASPGQPAGTIPPALAFSEEELERELAREAELASPGLRKYETLKNRALEHASREPEQLSQLIRTWIYEN